MQCDNATTFIKNIVEVNKRAGVAPDVINLIESYSFLRLRNNNEIDFYNSAKPFKPADKRLTQFIEKNKHLDERAKNFITAYYQEMQAHNLVCVFNTSHLAHLLEISLDDVHSLAKAPQKHYRIFSISKSNGSKRTIQAPNQRLKQVQRKILDQLLQYIPLNDHAEGFRRKRSILSNAARHVNKKVVLKLDIKDFFPSIDYQRVLGMFLHLGYPRQVAILLSSLTTYKQMLPTGAPTSPVIANIICRKLDKRLVNLGKKTGFSYSRYADDMTLSGNEEHVVKMIPFFKEIIREEGFAVNEPKLRILRRGKRQSVTGVVVNQHPNISRNKRKTLRAILHNCRTGNLSQQKEKWAREQKGIPHSACSISDFKRSLQAKVHYIKMINGSAGEKLLESFRLISWPT